MLVGFICGLCVLPLVAERAANLGSLELEAEQFTGTSEDVEEGVPATVTTTPADVDPAQAAVQAAVPAAVQAVMDILETIPINAAESLRGSGTVGIFKVGEYAVKVFPTPDSKDSEMAAWKMMGELGIRSLGSEPIAEAVILDDGKVVPAPSPDGLPIIIYRLWLDDLPKALFNRNCQLPVAAPACARDVMEWAKTRAPAAWRSLDYLVPPCQPYVVQALSLYKRLEEYDLVDGGANPKHFHVFDSPTGGGVEVLLTNPLSIQHALTLGPSVTPQHHLEEFFKASYNSFRQRNATPAGGLGFQEVENKEYRTAPCA